MVEQTQVLEHRTDWRTTHGCSEAEARLYRTIPDHVDHVPHSEYLCPEAEETLFGPESPTIPVPHWRSPAESEDGHEVELPKARSNLSAQDEALLFRRYNCARYHLADLMEKQVRCFTRGRVSKILTWHRRVLENQAALVEANLPLVVAMAKRASASLVELAELVCEGNMALLRAVDKFDFSRGYKFSTYACCAILKAISRATSMARTYHQRFPVNFEPGMERSDELGRRHADQRDLAIEDLQRVLAHNRAGLTDVEQAVLAARFALVGHDHACTLREVSTLVDLSCERVRQIQKGALNKLRAALKLVASPETGNPGGNSGAVEGPTPTAEAPLLRGPANGLARNAGKRSRLSSPQFV